MRDAWSRSQTLELEHWNAGLSQPSDRIATYRGAIDTSELIWKRFGFDPEHYEPKTVLDVGCGPTARCACFLGSELIGLDPLMRQYEELPSAVLGCYTYRIHGDAETYRKELEASADLIACINCLDHCRDPRIVLDNMRRYCRGECLLSVDCSDGAEEMHPSRMPAMEVERLVVDTHWTITWSDSGRAYPRCDGWDDGWSPNVTAYHWRMTPC